MPTCGSRASRPASRARFGDFRAGYTVVDRVGIRSLRDPYSNKPYVGFYVTKRVGGMVVNSEAIKVLKFSTT
jgi:HK97 family phage major capsid protein